MLVKRAERLARQAGQSRGLVEDRELFDAMGVKVRRA